MIKNNKGVTLVELLIVIVVMGIIAAFAIPAVGQIITNTQKDASLADALAVENAAKLYCSQTTCTSTQQLTWTQISGYVEGVDATYYDMVNTGHGTAGVVAVKSSGDWQVYLEKDGVDNPDTDDAWEWTAAAVPSNSSRTQVIDDDNDEG